MLIWQLLTSQLEFIYYNLILTDALNILEKVKIFTSIVSKLTEIYILNKNILTAHIKYTLTYFTKVLHWLPLHFIPILLNYWK